MKVNVIGGSGFIGTRLSMRLQKNKIPFSIIDKVVGNEFPQDTIKVDIRSQKELINAVDHNSLIVNLAAEHRDDVTPKSLYDEVNVVGAMNVCQAAREKSCNAIIFTSTVAVYGFAPIGTDELGLIAPFNDYGRTKAAAEKIYIQWQEEDPLARILVIVRPTVVFGERNRGNVYNLLRQIASGRFIMIGDGLNRKSMAYVENVAGFLEHTLKFKPGVHIYNYTDKPDFTMNALVAHVSKILKKPIASKIRIPFYLGMLIGLGFDLFANLLGKKFSISAIRVRKFCSNSVYESAAESAGFSPPASLMEAIEKTVVFEFIEKQKTQTLFYSE
jgi:nucleoside-diphosphate-sugar epimerase